MTLMLNNKTLGICKRYLQATLPLAVQRYVFNDLRELIVVNLAI